MTQRVRCRTVGSLSGRWRQTCARHGPDIMDRFRGKNLSCLAQVSQDQLAGKRVRLFPQPPQHGSFSGVAQACGSECSLVFDILGCSPTCSWL